MDLWNLIGCIYTLEHTQHLTDTLITPDNWKCDQVIREKSHYQELEESPRLKISSVNEVDCRGSRRATMNQTQHQRWAYRSAGLQALIENQQHTIKTPVAAVL
jgi:hypothetical protein